MAKKEARYMDFIESAMIMVPALTGMDLTIYDGKSDTLAQFKNKCCFSSELQPIYTQQGLTAFLEHTSDEFIYDLEEALGTHLIIVQAKDCWVLLGPYVEEGWNEQTARLLLLELNVSEAVMHMYKTYRCKFPIVQQDYALKTALMIVEHWSNQLRSVKHICITQEGQNKSLTFSDVYTDASEINRRYFTEDRFIDAIISGDVSKAIQARSERNEMNTDFRYFKDSRQDQLVGTCIERTMIRIAAKLGGLSPVLIDTIIQEYAQKMCFSTSRGELDRLTIELLARFCAEIRKQQESGYSPLVRQAIDYMEINLSKSMTTAEIARAVGAERKRFVERFRKETSMTMKEYLANRRCIIAAQLLLDSRASVQEIAAYVGYPDSNYFSKVFKASIGVTPQAYRSTRRTSKVDNSN